ncbi:MAG: hypothetical protein Q9178_005097 [Gyalolechia marmorata]
MAETASKEIETGGAKQTLKDLFAGAAGGVAQVLLGQPFGTLSNPILFYAASHNSTLAIDIVKVRLQTTKKYTGAIDGATQIFKNEGPLAFYKVSVQFGGFHYARRQFEARNTLKGTPFQFSFIESPIAKPRYHSGRSPDLTYSQLYLSGAFAGLANSYLSGPIEHVRIRLQTQPHGAGRLYNGPLDCVRKLVKQGGGIGGLYRGQAVTLAREAMAYGVW